MYIKVEMCMHTKQVTGSHNYFVGVKAKIDHWAKHLLLLAKKLHGGEKKFGNLLCGVLLAWYMVFFCCCFDKSFKLEEQMERFA